MVIDTFPYFNERELLELRIRLLYDHVDKFIICEGDHTHKGDTKPLTCKQTLQELGLLTEKIQVVEVKMPSYDQEPDPWIRERMQRNAAQEFIQEGDVVFATDCDEIIDPGVIDYHVSSVYNLTEDILRLPMVNLSGRADLRIHKTSGEPAHWWAGFVCGAFHLQEWTLSDLRESAALGQPVLKYTHSFLMMEEYPTMGWHFTWMGNPQRRRLKKEAFAHWNDNIRGIGNLDSQEMGTFIEHYVPEAGSTDPLGREDSILLPYSVEKLPKLIFEIPTIQKFLFS